MTKQDFYNSNNIAVNESGLTQSGYEEIGISGVAQDVVGNYHLNLSKSSLRFGTNFDNTLKDRVIKYQTSPIIEITAGELQGSIMFKGIEDQLFSEGIKTIILTPSAINATLALTNAITIYLLDNSFTFSPGQLTVADSTALDFEMTPVFSLLIKVSDGALGDSAIFTINLIDVDEEEILSLADAAQMIYPNPSRGIIKIRTNQFKEATIYNLSGKRIMKAIDNRIDISALSEGVYIIRLENRSGDRFAMRLIKE